MMSNKPIKKSDVKKLNTVFERKLRIQNSILPPYTFILSEGTKTEPNYVKDMVGEINKKYYNFCQGDVIIVEGTARNTKTLLEYARERVEVVMPRAENVWLLYDKDDFPKDNFDNTFFSAKDRIDKRHYRAIWSNESFELWLLLHFQDLDTRIPRKQCVKLLKEHLGNYEKNMPNIYSLLSHNTDVALRRARKLFLSYEKDTPPSKMCPCTMVFELVEELRKYIS